MSRPQIGIDRLPARRMSNEPRESMNCKSCRKRKIKCNRLRPTCEACQVFACPCVYDAVPKKRGPKTDVLEALLKRVDGLEKRLRTEEGQDSPSQTTQTKEAVIEALKQSEDSPPDQSRRVVEIGPSAKDTDAINGVSSSSPNCASHSNTNPSSYPEVLLDTYFSRIHGKPYHILDEASTRQRLLTNQLPNHLVFAIYAVTARYASQYGGYNIAVQTGVEYARRARMEVDIDEPSIEALQTLILLSQAMFQAGCGKRAYTYLCSGITMTFALNLHRELPNNLRIAAAEREGRRRLFWACYLLDRFAACGSKRPSLITDECIVLRMPSYQSKAGAFAGEGDYFPSGFNLQSMPSTGKLGQGSMGMLIGIARILGITNRYLAAGGVKGDSHFPWHTLSNLSKIRSDLDVWATDTEGFFSSLESLFGQPDSTILVLSKLIYHLVHCLIYRPFLPVDLAELSGTSQHQSWQIEATNLCFLHANAIAELVEIGNVSSNLEWPAFVGYCVCTAGSIHVHGAHYQSRGLDIFATSTELLSREMQQLSELRYSWAGTQHQQDVLQKLYEVHSELVKSLASSPMRFSPVFHSEDFFDRYTGQYFDGAHFAFVDINLEESVSSQQLNGANHLYRANTQPQNYNTQSFYPLQTSSAMPSTPQGGPPRKRRATVPSKPSPSPSGLVPVTFNGVPSADTYQSPYISSSSHGRLNSVYNSTRTVASPTFKFNSETNSIHQTENQDPNAYDPTFSMPAQFEQEENSNKDHHNNSNHTRQHTRQRSPNAPSATGSVIADGDGDPFLSLLEQLAENEQSRGGPSELDFFLSNG
ncbi:hypothetical protein EJ08DRAFT_49897 [Tothia fuscella]|uniref:Zn(2)-C6 fungal-type domain-containing protein n=1 Tax=Tothia fuscella TaxID=1048955 RepID=A0A9P4NF99_9PEZI|nr:hypothetical protein EJ08DRAFT_49897 [Tothia fuscella]